MMHAEHFEVLPIVEWMERYTSAVERTGQDRWQFKLNSGLELTGSAIREQDWLRMQVRLSGERVGMTFDSGLLHGLLLQNAILPGGVKFCLGEDVFQATLAAEIPIQEDEAGSIALEPWMGEVFTGLRQGALKWSILHASVADGPSAPIAQRRSAAEPAAEEQLADLCERIGWSFTKRSSGQVAIRLDVRDAFCQALLGPDVGQMGRLRVSLGMTTSSEGESQRAVALLLLSASRLVRMARASASPAGDAIEYRWEVVLPTDYGTEILGHALGALSVACQLTARELQAMEDRKIAREYLAMRGVR